MTTAPDVAVVATNLAHTDRRALSQAWYSALHLAHDDPQAAASAHVARAASSPSFASAQRPLAVRGAAGHAAAHAPARAARPREANAPLVDRRSTAGDAARRVERALATIVRTPRRATSQTVAIAGGRVTLLVRTDGSATRIVALCSEPLRATVERALAHARFAIAARGEAVSAS